jgi:hypothetical protein
MNGLTLTENASHIEISQSIEKKVEAADDSFKAYTKQVPQEEEEEEL